VSPTSENVPCNDSGVHCSACVDGVCQFQNVYGTCDLKDPAKPCYASGPMYSDLVSVGSLAPARMTFGAISNQTTNFQQFDLVDGVLGLMGPVGSWGEPTLMHAMYKQGVVANNTFGFCLARGPIPGATSTPCADGTAGMLTLGGIDNKLGPGPIPTTPDVGKDGGFFQVIVEDVTVGDAAAGSASVLPRKAILDSGTNVLMLVRAVAPAHPLTPLMCVC